jgi:NADPH:quinone reductase-like Zn-dependent oxidoreductase
MATATNQAAWLDKAGTPLEVRDAPMPKPGSGEIVVQNVAVAMNGVDNWILGAGVFIKQWPAVIGNDIAGIIYDIGSDVQRFKKGDRIVGLVKSSCISSSCISSSCISSSSSLAS